MNITGILRRLTGLRRQKEATAPAVPAPSRPFDQQGHEATMARIEFNIASHWDERRLEAELRQRLDKDGMPASSDPVLVDTVRVIRNIQRRRAGVEGDRPPLIFTAT